MFRSKKFIIAASLVAVAVAGCIGGVAIADDGESDEIQTDTILDKVTAVLVADGVNITSEQLKNAFTEVRSQQRTEAVERLLARLVENGDITQEEAAEYSQWWSEKPETLDGFGLRGRIGGIRAFNRTRICSGLCAPETVE